MTAPSQKLPAVGGSGSLRRMQPTNLAEAPVDFVLVTALEEELIALEGRT